MSIRKIVSWIKPRKSERMSYDAIFKGSAKVPASPIVSAQPGLPVTDGQFDAYFKDVFGGAVL